MGKPSQLSVSSWLDGLSSAVSTNSISALVTVHTCLLIRVAMLRCLTAPLHEKQSVHMSTAKALEHSRIIGSSLMTSQCRRSKTFERGAFASLHVRVGEYLCKCMIGNS